jgi:hypothetical protein
MTFVHDPYPAVIIPQSTILQSIDTTTKNITLAPACWIPAGSVLTGTQLATLSSISGFNNVTGTFNSIPEIIIGSVVTGGEAGIVKQAIVKAVTTGNSTSGYTLTGITISSAGSGYLTVPDVRIKYNGSYVFDNALTAVMSNTPVAIPIAPAVNGANTTTLSVNYQREPGATGFITTTALTTNLITLDSVAGLVVNNKITFTRATNGADFGGLVTGTSYYIRFIDSTNKQIVVGSSLTNTTYTVSATSNNTGSFTCTGVYMPVGTLITVTGTDTNSRITGFVAGRIYKVSVGTAAGAQTTVTAFTLTDLNDNPIVTNSAGGGAISLTSANGASFSVSGTAGSSTGNFGQIVANSDVTSTNTSSGTIVVVGGMGISGNVILGGILKANLISGGTF